MVISDNWVCCASVVVYLKYDEASVITVGKKSKQNKKRTKIRTKITLEFY